MRVDGATEGKQHIFRGIAVSCICGELPGEAMRVFDQWSCKEMVPRLSLSVSLGDADFP